MKASLENAQYYGQYITHEMATLLLLQICEKCDIDMPLTQMSRFSDDLTLVCSHVPYDVYKLKQNSDKLKAIKAALS